MTDEKMIEEAAKAIANVRWNHALPHANPAGAGWTDVDLARAALAVFEKAHAPNVSDRPETDISPAQMSVNEPTGDEREGELERLRHVAETMRAVSDALRTRYADDSSAAYFMREINTALDAVLEPQGEPSDAMVEAGAREAFFTDDAGGHIRGRHTWDTIPEVGRENYRTMVRGVLHAALRAAGEVRQ